MASQKTKESPSPSASSIFLPLGRRGSRSSLSTQAERETLTEALDQIHSAAYQSETLTVFNEFTSPQTSLPVVENNNESNDSQGGLSGLYSRLRASVSGATKDNGSGRRVEGAPAVSTNKSTGGDNNATTVNESQNSSTNSAQASKANTPLVGTLSPATESFNAAQAFQASKKDKLGSKPNSISSSKTSLSSTPVIKSPVPPLTKTVDPALTEVNVSVPPDGLQKSEPSGGNRPLGTDPTVTEGDDSLRSPRSEDINGISTQQSYSPVLSGKLSNREGSISTDPYFGSKPGNVALANDKPTKSNSAGFNRRDLAEIDTSVGLNSRNIKQADSNDDTLDTENGNTLTTSSSSMTADESTAPTSAGNSIRRESEDDGLNRRSSNTHPSASLEDDLKTLDPSKLSIDRPHEKLAKQVSTSRLPGYVMSRVSSSEITTTQSPVPSNPSTQSFRQQRPIKVLDNQSGTFNQLKSKLLSKEFWMKDENAKDCFLCGEPFTTFRRKHHCRTCGQIFDSKCTSLLSGIYFDQSSSVRVCKPCEDMINSRGYDSSDLSDIEPSPVTTNPGNMEFPLNGMGASGSMEDEDDASSIISQSIEHVLKTPTMAIPATRRVTGNGDHRSAVLEIESERPLIRPTSSRSLRSSASLRSHPMGHKRHHSRQQHLRGFKSYHEDRAPFQRRHLEDSNRNERLSAFHRDNIIDPDLAQYLSDDASSGDEQPNLLTVASDSNISKSGAEHERATFSGLLAAVKKGRSRFGDRNTATGSISIRDGDDASITSSKAVNLPRNSRRRNLSIASSIHQRPSPRMPKDSPLFFHDHHSPSNSQLIPSTSKSGFKMTRSSSMRGSSAPAIELNRLSLEHVRKLLRQLLEDTSIPHASSWETALLPILLKATDDVDPDVQRGDDMDIRNYVKLKKIPGGRPGDTSYVSGLVFTKNLALKSMPRSIARPRILIITFPLEYARHQQHFMSLEPVIRQEREFLENLVSRIAALQPNLLLVEKSVSGLALELLEKLNIATAYNVKPSVLGAVSRCTQTKIITSMDKLVAVPAHTGYCDSFDLKTYVYGGRRKTYMYISGCSKELGCTIVLRGANEDVLAKVKRITEFMVYVVYNLKLETCLMRDEFAKLPTVEDFCNDNASAGEKPGISKKMLAGGSAAVHENSTPSDAKDNSSQQTPIATTVAEVPDDVPMPTYYEDMVKKHQTKLLSASPCVKFEAPYLLMRARELERRVSYLAWLRDREPTEQNEDEKNKAQKFMLITPEMVHQNPDNASAKVKEVLRAVHEAELDRAMHNYLTQKRQWEAYLSGNSNLFDPYSHQNIAVLYSLVCTTTSIPCSGPDIFALDFYNEHEGDDRVFEADCTLGQYVEDLCLEANSVCTANGCENRMFEHHRQYVHGEAQISIFVQPQASKLRGLQDTILMWGCCKVCGNETQVIPMSANTWRYSFAKYLELSFWSRNLRARAGVCQHDIHRDYLRFFGFKDMALRIQYDPITLLDISVPRTRVTWKVDNDLRLRNEVYNKFEHRITKFMLSVKSRLKSIRIESVIPEKVEDYQKEIEILVKKANDDHNSLIRHLQEKYTNSHYWEVIPLNEVLRAVQEKVVEWDMAFADFEKNFFPSEKDIRRLASLQLKKIFLDKDASATSLTSTEETPTTPTEKETPGTGEEGDRPRSVRRMTLSPEKAKDVLVSVLEEHSGKIEASNKANVSETPISDMNLPATASASDPNLADQGKVEHLDLAVQTRFSDDIQSKHQASTDLAPPSRPETPFKDSNRLTSSPELPSHFEFGQKDETRTSPKQTSASSGIPRPVDRSARRNSKGKSPPMFRAHSQPLNTLRDNGTTVTRSTLKLNPSSSSKITSPLPSPPISEKPKLGDKRLSDRITLNTLKTSKGPNGHSMIPRSITPKNKNPRVSSLARHFEQLSREFEKERQRERLQRAAKSKHSRAYPIISSKATVEVYNDVREAVEEREPSGEGEEFFSNNLPTGSERKDGKAPEESATNGEKDLAPENIDSTQENDQRAMAENSFETEEAQSDEDQSLTTTDSPEESMKIDDDMDLKELPKHERNTLVKMLANFWAERSASGWQPLDYPLKVSDHVFADCDIIVREDEPSSLIAFALDSSDYKNKLASIQDEYDREDRAQHDAASEMEVQNQVLVESALLRTTGMHLKYQFQEGQAKMLCKVFYAEQFDALRRKCGVADRIVESLSRCAKWDSKGGKTKSLFLKTLDDRFVLKSLSQIETQAFLKFAPAYFRIMSEALFHELPSAIAKMFGFYQIIIKNPVTGVEFNWFLLLMENLFYDREPTRIFDLKGSMRNRKVQSTGERDEVLLDENMVDFIYETPLFTREHSKKLLSQSVWNDTLFLGRQNVMDYSLMIAIDEPHQELVVGIIDCIRTYTWDKKLESWIKDRGLAGGGKNRPTVTSPKEYKSRFREAMARYVLQAPNCWNEFHSTFIDSRRIDSQIHTPLDTENSELTIGTNNSE